MKNNLVFGFAGLCAVAIFGCESIVKAEKAQEELAARADDGFAGETGGKIDLTALDLEGLVDYALTNRPQMATAALSLEDARLALKAIDANAPLLSDTPWNAISANGSAGYNESSERSHGLRWAKHGNASASLSVELLLWDWGRHEAEAKAQVERILAAELALVDEGFAVFSQVSTAYFEVLTADALLEISQTNELVMAVQEERARQRLEAGETQRSDYLQAKKNLAAAKEQSVVRRDAVKTAGAQLVKVLGLDASKAAREDVLKPLANPLVSYKRAFADTTGTVDGIFADARTNAPNMRIARARLRAASRDVDAAKAEFYPTLSLSGSVNWTDPLWMWSWGANLAQNIFSGFRTETALERAVVAMKAAAANIDAEEQELSKSLFDAVATRDDAKVAFESAAVTYEAAKENYEVVAQQYLVGECNQLDYADAVNSLVTAMGEMVRNFYSGQIAEASIFRLTGEYPVYAGAGEGDREE